jgi:hypothetical protein
MKTLKVEFKDKSSEKTSAKGSKAKAKSGKPMDFATWVEHYSEMSKGNPV